MTDQDSGKQKVTVVILLYMSWKCLVWNEVVVVSVGHPSTDHWMWQQVFPRESKYSLLMIERKMRATGFAPGMTFAFVYLLQHNLKKGEEGRSIR